MRRFGLLGLAAFTLAGAGCRSTSSCGEERRGLFSRRHDDDACDALAGYGTNGNRSGGLMSRLHGSPTLGMPVAASGWSQDNCPTDPGGYPGYPSGQSLPTRLGGPQNELPYPTIPSPGVPEAVPAPAVPFGSLPAPAVRTTADAKK